MFAVNMPPSMRSASSPGSATRGGSSWSVTGQDAAALRLRAHLDDDRVVQGVQHQEIGPGDAHDDADEEVREQCDDGGRHGPGQLQVVDPGDPLDVLQAHQAADGDQHDRSERRLRQVAQDGSQEERGQDGQGGRHQLAQLGACSRGGVDQGLGEAAGRGHGEEEGAGHRGRTHRHDLLVVRNGGSSGSRVARATEIDSSSAIRAITRAYGARVPRLSVDGRAGATRPRGTCEIRATP